MPPSIFAPMVPTPPPSAWGFLYKFFQANIREGEAHMAAVFSILDQ